MADKKINAILEQYKNKKLTSPVIEEIANLLYEPEDRNKWTPIDHLEHQRTVLLKLLDREVKIAEESDDNELLTYSVRVNSSKLSPFELCCQVGLRWKAMSDRVANIMALMLKCIIEFKHDYESYLESELLDLCTYIKAEVDVDNYEELYGTALSEIMRKKNRPLYVEDVTKAFERFCKQFKKGCGQGSTIDK